MELRNNGLQLDEAGQVHTNAIQLSEVGGSWLSEQGRQKFGSDTLALVGNLEQDMIAGCGRVIDNYFQSDLALGGGNGAGIGEQYPQAALDLRGIEAQVGEVILQVDAERNLLLAQVAPGDFES